MGHLVGAPGEAIRMLRQCFFALTAALLPTAVVLAIIAPLLPGWLGLNFGDHDVALFGRLIGAYAPAIVFGGWTALLARYVYAIGSTAAPVRIEIIGVVIQIALAIALFPFVGAMAIAIGFSAGYLVSATLLGRLPPVAGALPVKRRRAPARSEITTRYG